MPTRSLIGVNSNSNIRSIYCHFDSYPEHHMPILKECYQTQEKANLLIDQGGISILDRRIGEEQFFINLENFDDRYECVWTKDVHYFQKADEETCLFYMVTIISFVIDCNTGKMTKREFPHDLC